MADPYSRKISTGQHVVVPVPDPSYDNTVPALYTNQNPDRPPIYTPASLHSVSSTASDHSARSGTSRSTGRTPKSSTSKSQRSRTEPYSSKREVRDSEGYLKPDPPQAHVTFAADVEDDSREGRKRRRRRRKKWKKKAEGMDYLIDDIPPWYLCVVLAFQHLVIMFGATVALPISLAPNLCLGDETAQVVSDLIGTTFVCSGLVTFLQTTIGTRLPIVQGGSFTFLPPAVALLSMERLKCVRPAEPDPVSTTATSFLRTTAPPPGTTDLITDMTSSAFVNYTTEPPYNNLTSVTWREQIREIQGGVIIASLFQMLIGFAGITGFVLRFLGPISVAPTVALIGMGLFDTAVYYSSKQWWITLVTVVLIAAFSQYSKNINVPCFEFKKGTGCVKVPFPLFRLFSVLLAVAIAWIIHLILVKSGVLPVSGSTMSGIDTLSVAKWFRFPYPFQWGAPTFSAAGVFGMSAAVLASTAESIGDYFACARISYNSPPPNHAVNRGIGVEGIGLMLCGFWGTGSGTTSYSENVGAIGITKVASRRVIQYAAVAMVILGVMGKVGVFFVLIPDPVIGGVFAVMFGMVTAVGISNLQFVDLNSMRNLFIVGFAFFAGLTVPKYIRDHNEIIRTGNEVVNQIFIVLMTTSMFVGGMVAFVLDNTIPGSEEERGLVRWREYSQENPRRAEDESEDDVPQREVNTYDLIFLHRCMEEVTWTQYVPFLPSFREELYNFSKSKRRKARRSRKTEQEPEGEFTV